MEKREIKALSKILEESECSIVATETGCEFEGSTAQLMSLVTAIIKTMLDKKVFDEKGLDKIVKVSKMNVKELEKEALTKIKDLMDKMLNK